MLSRLDPAEIRPGSPISGPEALLRNIGKIFVRLLMFKGNVTCGQALPDRPRLDGRTKPQNAGSAEVAD